MVIRYIKKFLMTADISFRVLTLHRNAFIAISRKSESVQIKSRTMKLSRMSEANIFSSLLEKINPCRPAYVCYGGYIGFRRAIFCHRRKFVSGIPVMPLSQGMNPREAAKG
jgi:hypothetical protein